METKDKRVAYGVFILVMSAILLSLLAHSGRKAEPPKSAAIPWKGSEPSQAAPVSLRQDTTPQASTPEPVAQAPSQPSARQVDAAPPATPPPTLDLSASSSEEPASPDSEPSVNPSGGETASQRVARRLGRH